MPSSPGQEHNFLALARTDQPSEWDMQKGGTLYVRKMVQSYISAGVIRQYSIRLRADQIKVKHLISSVQYHGSVHRSLMKLDPS